MLFFCVNREAAALSVVLSDKLFYSAFKDKQSEAQFASLQCCCSHRRDWMYKPAAEQCGAGSVKFTVSQKLSS